MVGINVNHVQSLIRDPPVHIFEVLGNLVEQGSVMLVKADRWPNQRDRIRLVGEALYRNRHSGLTGNLFYHLAKRTGRRHSDADGIIIEHA
jgi:hypothetical protein